MDIRPGYEWDRFEGFAIDPTMLHAFLEAVPFAQRQSGRGSARDGRFVLNLANGERASARAVVIASGVRYRRPAAANLAAFEGTGVHYWASPLEANLCAGQEVALVGAGNSAGQAVVYLASQVRKVWLLVRGPSLATKMSRYLVDRIVGLSNVEVLTQAQMTGLEGNSGVLEAVRWRGPSGEETRWLQDAEPSRRLIRFESGSVSARIARSNPSSTSPPIRSVVTARTRSADAPAHTRRSACQHDWRASARCSAAARRDLSNEASRRRHRLR
jgi:hypothetical protein